MKYFINTFIELTRLFLIRLLLVNIVNNIFFFSGEQSQM